MAVTVSQPQTNQKSRYRLACSRGSNKSLSKLRPATSITEAVANSASIARRRILWSRSRPRVACSANSGSQGLLRFGGVSTSGALDQKKARIFQQVPKLSQELGAERAIDYPMVAAHSDAHPLPDSD